jgi:MFS-type transporter involved in bile tolerance (Atg22 family)
MTLRTIALLAAALAQHDPPLLTLLVVGCAHGCTQCILAAITARARPTESKGTAFGLFNLASGLFMLFASVMAVMGNVRSDDRVLGRIRAGLPT